MDTVQTYHVPVLLTQSIDELITNPNGVYVDATFGGGGHSKEILSRLGKDGELYSFDQDADAMNNIVDDDRFTFVYSNFRYMRNFMRYYGHEQVDGILADLGVSWHHFDDESRGFSFRFDAPLDMRMNQDDSLSCYDVVNTYSESELRTANTKATYYAADAMRIGIKELNVDVVEGIESLNNTNE